MPTDISHRPLVMTRCVGATGPLNTLTCTPANTAPNIVAATVGQCDGSGNGGTSVGFVCTVTGGPR